MPLAKHHAVVTGSTSGIGLAIARLIDTYSTIVLLLGPSSTES